MQIDDWILVLPLPENHKDQGDSGDEREDHNEVRFEPIIALPLVENNLQGSKAKGHEAEADVIDFGFTELAAPEIGRILNEPRGQENGNDSDGNVDEENPAPGEVVGDPSAERRPDGRSRDHGNAVHSESHAALGGRKSVSEYGLFAGLKAASASSLQHTTNDKCRQVRSKTAHE